MFFSLIAFKIFRIVFLSIKIKYILKNYNNSYILLKETELQIHIKKIIIFRYALVLNFRVTKKPKLLYLFIIVFSSFHKLKFFNVNKKMYMFINII